jgi:hypothetical protein
MRSARLHSFISAMIVLCSTCAFADITSSSNPALVGQPVVFTIQINAPADIAAIPTGSVTLTDGGVTIGTVPLADGVATLTAEFAGPGDHPIIAEYSGDQTFQPTNSPQLLEHVTATDAFTIGASPSMLNQHSGGTSELQLTLFANGTGTASVQLSCENLPPGVACSFQSNSVEPSSGGANTTMTITSAASQTAMNQAGPAGAWAAAVIFPLVIGGFLRPSLLCKKSRAFFLGTMFVVGTLGCTGCGKTLKIIQGGTPAGTYTIHVVGNDGAFAQTATVQLNIN